jgi:methyl-accepting chemotaxis protein
MFDAGAGEDYLSSIARESEQSATHLAHLKEGLVNDLKHLLDDFGERQRVATMAAADAVGQSVANTLEEPLGAMTEVMERSLEDQQAVVHRLMDESLNAFAGRLEDIVGAKLTDAAGHIETAAGTMHAAMAVVPDQIESAVARVRSVLEDIARSAEPIAANAERMSTAADKLAETIELSTETLDYAIERFRKLGEEMGTALSSSQEIGSALALGAEQAHGAAAALSGASERITELQSGLEAVVRSLSEVADRTERDGQVHRELTEALERAASQLTRAQQDVDEFLAGIAGALAETHETFSREINSTLNRTHESFHHSLAQATEQLAGTVSDFGEFLETDFRDSVENLQQEFARLGPPSNGQPEG